MSLGDLVDRWRWLLAIALCGVVAVEEQPMPDEHVSGKHPWRRLVLVPVGMCPEAG
jgi:hypothetical protein